MSDTPIWDQTVTDMTNEIWAGLCGAADRVILGFETLEDKADRYRER